MEKLFLCLDFSTQELNIVYEQYVNISVAALEIRGFVVTDTVDELIGELLGTDVPNMGSFEQGLGVVPNSVE